MDLSLDDIIKTSRKENVSAKKKATPPKGKGKSPPPKGKSPKGKGQPDANASLVKAVNQSQKAKRAAKMAAARGMDVDLPQAPVVVKGARSKGGKVMVGKKGGLANTLKARMSAAMSKLPTQAARPATVQKAASIKVTIPGASPAKGRGSPGRGGKGGRGKGGGGGRGGMVMPGASKPTGGGLIGQGIKKARKVVMMAGGKVALGGRATGRAPGGRGGGRGKGRGRGMR